MCLSLCDVIHARGPHRDPPIVWGRLELGRWAAPGAPAHEVCVLPPPRQPTPLFRRRACWPPWDLQTPPAPTPDGQGEGSRHAPWPPWSAVRHRPLQAAELCTCLTPPIQDTDTTSTPCSGIWRAGPGSRTEGFQTGPAARSKDSPARRGQRLPGDFTQTDGL